MKNLVYIVLGLCILFFLSMLFKGCGGSENQKFLIDFEEFIEEIEKNHESYDESDWDKGDDDLQNFVDKKNEFRLSSSENSEIESLLTKYEEMKSSFNTGPLEVNIYVDNSYSMNGYLTDKEGDFIEVVSSIVQTGDIQNVYSFNKDVESFEGTGDDYVKKLLKCDNNTENSNESDLNHVFKSVIDSVTDNSIGIMIGDGIYSVSGPVKASLKASKAQTSKKLLDRLNEDNDFETVVIKLEVGFDGTYYPFNYAKERNDIPWKDNRPYYIWVFGRSKVVKKYLKDLNIQDLKGYQNHARFFAAVGSDLPYSIMEVKTLPGTFRNDREFGEMWHTVIQSEADRTENGGRFSLAVAVDLGKLPLSKSYKNDKNKYSATNGYHIDSIGVIEESMYDNVLKSSKARFNNESFSPTHIVYLGSNQLNKGTVSVSIINKVPSWISSSSNEDDTELDKNTTFGFKYLMDGISKSYTDMNGEEYVKFNIEIK